MTTTHLVFLSLEEIAGLLNAQGLVVSKIEASDDPLVEDDSLTLTEDVHVQVGEAYLLASRWSESERVMHFGPARSRCANGVEAIVGDLRVQLEAAKPGTQGPDSRASL